MIHEIDLMQTQEYQEKLAQCIHCGLCLQACPTYRLWGDEADAPRGRIALMKAAADGRLSQIDVQTEFNQHINYCLACRSCESACPSGVQYGFLVEMARQVVEHNHDIGIVEHFMRWLGMKQLMPYYGRTRWLGRLVRLYEVSGMQNMVRKMRILPKSLKAMEDLLPEIPAVENQGQEGHSYLPHPSGKVLFFRGCLQDSFLPNVNQATIRVLQKNGFEVLIPDRQTCCGAAQAHSGDLDTARRLARQNIDAFTSDQSQYPIISNAGGCGLALKEYAQLLGDDPDYAVRAQQFSIMVKDITEFIANNTFAMPRREVRARVTYADSCHLRHGQKIIEQPRQILRQIPGIELIELGSPDQCCGSAGIYNILHPEVAEDIMHAKLGDIVSTGAEIVVTSNTGCYLQIAASLRKSGSTAKVLHIIELLDKSLD